MESIEVKGIDLEKMPDSLKIIAALVKRLGGEIILSEEETKVENFTGIMLYLGNDKKTIVIKAN